MMRGLLLVLLCCVTLLARAEDAPPPAQSLPVPQPVFNVEESFPLPDRYGLIMDFHGMIPATRSERLMQKLQALEARNGTQIVLLTVPSTGKEGVQAYAQRTFERWDIGNNGQGNGVLLLIDGHSGQFYIRTGAGIAGALPDVWLKQMIESVILPRWTPEQFLDAIDGAVDAMIERASGEETRQTTYDYDGGFELTWQRLGWSGLAVAGLLYAAYAFGWRRLRRQTALRPAWHAGTFGLLGAVVLVISLWPDPLTELLQRPAADARPGDLQIVKLEKKAADLTRLGLAGRYTVIAVTDSKTLDVPGLKRSLEDLRKLRPDVAVRILDLDYAGWTTGTLKRLHGFDMAMLPYFLILRPDGRVLTADKDIDQQAAGLLDAWHAREAKLAVRGSKAGKI